MDALKVWNGGVIVISHDSTFVHTCACFYTVAQLLLTSHSSQGLRRALGRAPLSTSLSTGVFADGTHSLLQVGDGKCEKFYGDVTEYKKIIVRGNGLIDLRESSLTL